LRLQTGGVTEASSGARYGRSLTVPTGQYVEVTVDHDLRPRDYWFVERRAVLLELRPVLLEAYAISLYIASPLLYAGLGGLLTHDTAYPALLFAILLKNIKVSIGNFRSETNFT